MKVDGGMAPGDLLGEDLGLGGIGDEDALGLVHSRPSLLARADTD
jgi:hypothetical protein